MINVLKLHESINWRALSLAGVILLPLVAAAIITRDSLWLQAALVTISAYIAVERSGTAPLGVVLHGAAMALSYLVLVMMFENKLLWTLCVAIIAGASVIITAVDPELRALGNFTFIPVLYLAFETIDRTNGQGAVHEALKFLPFMAGAVFPVVVLTAIGHYGRRESNVTQICHYSKVCSRTLTRSAALVWDTVLAVTLAVLLASAIVAHFSLPHGQWVIWSAASVVTGDFVTARTKLKDRLVGVVAGVPFGAAVSLLLPHAPVVVYAVSLIGLLTLVSFRRYVVGFAARSACEAIALILVGHSRLTAGERITDVILGCVIGVVFVALVGAMFKHLKVNTVVEAIGSR
jgi:Fusaric acid resistance protein-like